MHRLALLSSSLRAHLARARKHLSDDAGYTTETIVVTALLAALALAVVGIVVAKVMTRANGINLG
ncbi:hypothetical protein [Streptomyces sp. NPDC042319]|uniref:hypothetical protein n=1 Tax=Streptomyces sp. NPDC042319 TaxID=3154332 RepID=UPI0033FA5053